jgi:phosphoribosylaminoimidazolecarboxamide formyltransferase/IMP cyclohydrolase
MRAILSVFDKAGLVPFAKGLEKLGFELFSTGGTLKEISQAGVAVKSVSQITGFPEILDGRVKTLHPVIHGGILARRDLAAHREEMSRHNIQGIDLVAVNLYPFLQTVAKPGVSLEDALENIDIGGPTMLRAAAKNFPHVLVVCDPADYDPVLAELGKGSVSLEMRRKMAYKAFQHVALYDTAIAQYLRAGQAGFPEEMTIALTKRLDLRYGENPHQQAAFYKEVAPGAVSGSDLTSAVQLSGPELSFNNILDMDSALAVASDFEPPTVAIIKHNNPCGLASHLDLTEAYRRALAGDPVAAFGGIMAVNRTIDLALAQEIDKTHYDGIIAPEFAPPALDLLKRKSGLRLLATGRLSLGRAGELDLRRVKGGLLVQTFDAVTEERSSFRIMSKRQPTPQEWSDLLFAWRAVKHIKSNAIVLVKDQALLGMGAGQPSRVVSVELALKRAESRAKGSVVGSDAFFPFADGVELAARAGASAVIEPGGSVRDKEAIETADRYGMAMVFTGVRHFKH